MFRWTLTVIAITVPVTAQIPDFTPPTPLFRAVLGGDTSETKRLLEAGADPNEGRFIGATPLVTALMNNQVEAAQLLLGKGADIKAADAAGSTPLMWAAASEALNISIVKELLSRGADPSAANKSGDTALTWALRRGYTPVVEMLRKHGASDSNVIRDSIERAVALMQKSGPEFVKVSGCTSCHHQSLPQMAFEAVKQRGVHIDPVVADKQAKAVIGMFRPYREQMLEGKENIPDPAISVSYSLIGLGAAGYRADDTTAAMARLVSLQQLPDGSFRCFTARPPMESSAVSAAALSLRALQLYGENPEPQVRKAVEWLRTAKAVTNEERTMRLLGLAWGKADSADLRAAARALVSAQRPDGGWAQLQGLESDSYATGQALVALLTAGQIDVIGDEYKRGAGFLLRTQRPDGSWLVRTRSFPFQPYRESGFPHGKDQWISISGTSWAVMALADAIPRAAQISGLTLDLE